MRKRIFILIFVFILGFSTPLYFSQGAGVIAYITKEFGLDLVARALARKFLSNLGNGVVDSINKLGLEDGRSATSFVQNWKKFLADAQTVGENQFRSQLDYVSRNGILCGDLQGPLSLAFQANNIPAIDIGRSDRYQELKQDTLLPYQTKIRCTVPDQVRNDFRQDFEKGGGWDTWSRTVEPQNNLLGALGMSLEELYKQRGSQQKARQSETVAGGGFAGVQGPCRGEGKTSQCAFLGKVLTPGDILGKGAAGWLDDNKKFLVSSDELSEVLLNILSAALKKIENFSGVTVDGTDVIQTAPDFKQQVKQDCLDTCVGPKYQSCNSPAISPSEQVLCRNDAYNVCNQQCSTP